MYDVESLPVLKRGVKVRFTGSIDKTGGNADWDWWLYQDTKTGEWVIFDEVGPGCLLHFYNHRRQPGYQCKYDSKPYDGPDTIYRFYLDGAETPQFTIKASEFGKLAGFESPLTDMYLDWVKRMWFPMHFRTSCRVTCSERLVGSFPGGWGGIVWHSYADDLGRDFEYSMATLAKVRKFLSVTPGHDPKPTDGNTKFEETVTVAAGDVTKVFETTEEGVVAALRVELSPYSPEWLQKLRLQIWFDDYSKPCVDAPFGGFFGNGIGLNNTSSIMQGLIPENGKVSGYSFYPMPFWRRARIALAAPNDFPADVTAKVAVEVRPSSVRAYDKSRCGYFRSQSYGPFTPQTGDDVEYAVLRGTGHMVRGTFSAWTTCESDFHFYVDRCRTPVLESDGAESWAGFGWGSFGTYACHAASLDTAPKRGPRSTVLGFGDDFAIQWCQSRWLLSDWYPFSAELVARQEHSARHNLGDESQKDSWWTFMPPGSRDYEGTVLYYGVDRETVRMTDMVDVGMPDSEKAHDFRAEDSEIVELRSRFEGCDFGCKVYSGGLAPQELTQKGRATKGFSEFTVAVGQDNDGVMLRRWSDQFYGRQRATVFVDGKEVTERIWYRANRNPHLRWLDDEFEIPVRYTRSKSSLRIRIEFMPVTDMSPQPLDGDKPATSWSEFAYQVFTRML